MKNVSLQEFMSMHIENRDHKSDYLQTAQELSKQVSQFLPTEVVVQVAVEDGKNYFEQANVRIIHPALDLYISFSSYAKKYSVYCRSIDSLKNIDHYAKRRVQDQLTQPNNIGVLSMKKIQSWIQYYETYFELLQSKDAENGNAKSAFLQSLEGLPVEWFNKGTNGRILRNGLEFSFTIHDTCVSTKLEIHYTSNKDLAAFLAMADNKYGSVKEEVLK